LLLGDLLLWWVEEEEEEDEEGRCDLVELLVSGVVGCGEVEECLGILVDEEEGDIVVFSGGVEGLEREEDEEDEDTEEEGGFFTRSHFSFCACLYSST